MKRNILYIAMACMTLFASCKKEINQVLPEAVEMEFGATVDDNGSKTYLSGTSVLWADGDQISVNGTAIDLVAGAGYRYGTFRGKVTPYNTNSYYVGYPASATTFNAGTMSVAIPAAQTYNSTQTLLGVMPMAAYIEGTGNKMTLHFHNAANLLKFQLFGTAGDASKVTRIEITSTAALTGKVPVSANGTDGVTFDYNSMTDLGYTITLDCGAGVQLTNTATLFYVIIPKIASSATLNVKIYCANGAYQENTLTSAFNSVNQIYSTAAKEVSAANIAGALPGEFSVADGKKVRFSQGNLQYHTTNDTWRFAEHQWDMCDAAAGEHSTSDYASNTNKWIDLFGWGATGFKDTRISANTYQTNFLPYSTSTTPATAGTDQYDKNRYGYGPDYVSPYYNLEVQYKSDWGCNTVFCGTTATNEWRTLTSGEWDYLLANRSVNGGTGEGKSYQRTTLTLQNSTTVYGLLIVPDDFIGTLSATTSWTDWQNTFEPAGVAFLPAAGRRDGTTVDLIGSHGYYWSNSYLNNYQAKSLYFEAENFFTQNSTVRYYGRSVRLVRDASNSGGVIEPFELENWE